MKELSDDAVEEILYGSDDRIKIKSSLIGTSSDYFVTYEGVVKYIQMLQEKMHLLQRRSGRNSLHGPLFVRNVKVPG